MVVMPTAQDRKRRRVSAFHKWIANPVNRHLPTQVVLETIGRKSGKPRRTPIGGRLIENRFWLVSDHGEAADYVRNIKSNNRIRLRLLGRWCTGSAYLMPSDDAHARLKSLPRFNSAMVRALGTDLLTVRIDLDSIPTMK
jgi:deazaflavin-dependent oxidoreductase (nitroreductase family)